MSRPRAIVIVAVLFAGFIALMGNIAIAAQDRYTLKLGKLSFGDFKGYENWKNIAVSQTETLLKVILANDVMIAAYRKGLPADGKLFPEGSKIVKIEWTMKKNTVSPYFVMVPDTLKAVATIEKDSKRFPDTLRTRAASGIMLTGTTTGPGGAFPGLGQAGAGNARVRARDLCSPVGATVPDRTSCHVPGSLAWSCAQGPKALTARTAVERR